MFKIVCAELKKTVSRPGIYVLSLLLAVLLVFGAVIYKPETKETKTFELAGSTFLEKYANFNQTNADKKAEADQKLEETITSINNYTITSTPSSKQFSQEEYIEYLIEKFEQSYDEYQDCVNHTTINQFYIDNARTKLCSSIENINLAVENAIINSQIGSYTLLTSKSNYESFKDAINNVYSWAQVTVSQENLRSHIDLFEEKYKNSFYSTINDFEYPELSNKTIKEYSVNEEGTKLFILKTRLNDILAKIDELKKLAVKNENNEDIEYANAMDTLANEYVFQIDSYVKMVKLTLICNAFEEVDVSEHKDLLYLSDYSFYNSKSELILSEYMFKNGKSETDFATPLTIGINSNEETNGYDYAYFVLKAFAFIIIVYAIIASFHTISGEIKEGSMRYLAIKPFSRTQLILGKWFSILAMSMILLVFSLLISLCVGAGMYGLSSNTILTIFNSNVAVTFHPIGMIILAILSIMLEIVVYSSIAMLLSTILKSDLLGSAIILVVYLINLLLPLFAGGVNSWLGFYPFSHISLYVLFGSTLYSPKNNFFNSIFEQRAYAGTNIGLTICMIAIICLSCLFVAIKKFKKKEL